jgi:5-methylcytosine-specific restriction protein A
MTLPRICPRCRQVITGRCPCNPRRPGYTNAERVRRLRTVQAWVAEHGPYCPGWGREGHLVALRDLTADHVAPVAAGGSESGALRILCRGCNSRRGDGG